MAELCEQSFHTTRDLVHNLSFQPYALALAMLSIYSLFVVELIAFRWGTARLARLGLTQGQCLLVDCVRQGSLSHLYRVRHHE